jgi:hypothetical protein
MALIKCAECGREISDKAAACPNCGAPVQAAPAAGTTTEGTERKSAGASSALGIVAVIVGLGAVIMPYFAAVFLIPAAFVCGVLAYKRGQKRLGGAGMVLAVLGLIGVIYVSQQITNIVQDPFAPNSLLGTDSPPMVTLSEYERVSNGMTYTEVTAIIGASGQELSRSDIAGFSSVMYSWSNANGSNMNAMFQNGRLVNKAQFGLR